MSPIAGRRPQCCFKLVPTAPLSGSRHIVQPVPEILYEDNHILAVAKPAGLLTQGDISGVPSLLDIVKAHIKRRDRKPGNVFLGMVQRLDRPVSGVIIFAKTSKAASRLSSQIREHKVGKLYVAVTKPNVEAAADMAQWREVAHHLQRNRDTTRVVGFSSRSSQHALLRMKTLCSNEQCGIHLITLITGRKHQIRAQLAHLDLAIMGDTKYGSQQSYPVQDGIGLHAVCCSFEHPVRCETLNITAAVPDAFFLNLSGADTALIRALIESELP